VNIPLIAHNTFISVLVELGVFGALLLFAVLAGVFYAVYRMKYLERRFWLALLMTWVIGVCSVTWENRKVTWLLFGLVAAHFHAKQSHRTIWVRREDKILLSKRPGWHDVSSTHPVGAMSSAFGDPSL
jgi:hypothetical protein